MKKPLKLEVIYHQLQLILKIHCFLLYTSGSTGSPKGVVHTTAGYLLGAALTTKYVFDIHPEDVLFTAGDVGWITGHTYALYGPLTLGTATIIFESTPAYPDYGRYWRIIERHKATHFYVAPTALRLIKRVGEEEIGKYDLSSLRTLGSVGEPIAPDLWEWYNEKLAKVDVLFVILCGKLNQVLI